MPEPQNLKRRHHFLPASYLSGFATTDNRRGLLWVFDRKEKRKFQQTCENVAFKTDYYSVAIDGVKPDAVEDAFALIEGEGKRVIRRVNQEKQIPSGKDYDWLMGYLGLLAARVPLVREHWVEQFSNLHKTIAQVAISHKTAEEIYDEMERAGQPLESLEAAKEMREFALLGDYTMSTDNTGEVKIVIDQAEILTDLLSRRSWSVAYKTDNQQNDFITSDSPVMLFWITKDPPNPYPGFGLPGTKVYVPLTRNTALFGMFDREANQEARLTNRLIKKHNYLCAAFADRFLFGLHENFRVIDGHDNEYDYVPTDKE